MKKYLDKINLYQDLIKKEQKLDASYSLGRLVCFFLLVMTIFLCFDHLIIGLILTLICLLLFIFLIKKHDGLRKLIIHHELLKEAYEDIIKRDNGSWKEFSDLGSEFINDNRLAIDLDLLGKNSLFQFINIAKTDLGRSNLANSLLLNKVNFNDLNKRQAAIKTCYEHEDLMMELIAYLKQIKKVSYEGNNECLPYSHLSCLIMILISFASIIAWLIFIIYKQQLFITITIPLCLILALLFNHKHQQLLANIEANYESIQAYELILNMLSKDSFDDEILLSYQQSSLEYLSKLKQLKKILFLCKQRKNMLFYLIINIISLYDFLCYQLYAKWLINNYDLLAKVEAMIGDIEVLLSFASFKQIHPHSCQATLNNELCYLEVEDMYHPLLNKDKAISNSFKSHGKVVIITGSNMSGKTTFMRTLALNYILFACGCDVCCHQASFSKFKLKTSMRLQDDMSEGISTFYQEVLAMKEMVDDSKLNIPSIYMIDEILKGTNYQERISCSETIIKALNKPHILLFVTTHDFDLCSLDYVENYYFSQHFTNNKVTFDYHIKEGVSQGSNAKAIMQMVGLKITE